MKALALTVSLSGAVFGLATFLDMLDTRYQRTISEWPTVSGTVTSTERGERGDWDDYDVDPTLTIRFEYMVQSVTYQSSQELHAHDDYREESEYPLGTSVIVHYDPARPNKSLINTTQSTPWWEIVMLYLFCFLAFFTLILFIYIWGWWVRGKSSTFFK
jgi:hypothetical protein